MGINYVLSHSDVLIYPNPSTGKITISILELEHSISKIEIIGWLGRITFSKEYLNNGLSDVQIDLSSLSKGNYVLNKDHR